jgi:HEPN domain-containing protein
MNLRQLAEGYLKQAEARLRDAGEAAFEGNNAYALRLSQESVELCVKAVLRSVAIEYPKQHEVSDLLIEFRKRFPDWFSEEIDFIHEASVSLFKKRELAFYGGEDLALPPDKVISAEDGKKAVEACDRVFKVCSKLLGPKD